MAISPCSNWDDMGSQRAPKSLSYCLRVVPIPCSSYKHHKLHHNSTCPQACSATYVKSPHTRHYTQTEKKLNQKHHQWTHHYTSETVTADFDLSILTSTRFSFLDKQYRGAAFLFAFSIPLSLAFFHDQSDSMYLLSRDCSCLLSFSGLWCLLHWCLPSHSGWLLRGNLCTRFHCLLSSHWEMTIHFCLYPEMIWVSFTQHHLCLLLAMVVPTPYNTTDTTQKYYTPIST